MNGSDDWGRGNHDITQSDLDHDAEVDRWLGYVVVGAVILAVWKVLDLVIWLGRLILAMI